MFDAMTKWNVKQATSNNNKFRILMLVTELAVWAKHSSKSAYFTLDQDLTNLFKNFLYIYLLKHSNLCEYPFKIDIYMYIFIKYLFCMYILLYIYIYIYMYPHHLMSLKN